jgi:hypothetical protein
MSDDEHNNEVLNRLWNDPVVRERTRVMGELFPDTFTENEMLTDKTELMEAGYTGRLPQITFRIGKFVLWGRPALFRDFWIRARIAQKPGKYGQLYSIIREKEK